MNQHILSMYKTAKDNLKEAKREISQTAMVLQSLEDVLPDWEVRMYANSFVDFTAPGDISIPEFMKVIDKLAKRLNFEPIKAVSEDNVVAVFKVYFWPCKTFDNRKYTSPTRLEFRAKNSEPCEITYKRKMQKVPVLTGYCKEIAEMKHLNYATV